MSAIVAFLHLNFTMRNLYRCQGGLFYPAFDCLLVCLLASPSKNNRLYFHEIFPRDVSSDLEDTIRFCKSSASESSTLSHCLPMLQTPASLAAVAYNDMQLFIADDVTVHLTINK